MAGLPPGSASAQLCVQRERRRHTGAQIIGLDHVWLDWQRGLKLLTAVVNWYGDNSSGLSTRPRPFRHEKKQSRRSSVGLLTSTLPCAWFKCLHLTPTPYKESIRKSIYYMFDPTASVPLHREPDMRRYPDPQHLWWQSYGCCRSRAIEQFTATSQRCWLTVQSRFRRSPVTKE